MQKKIAILVFVGIFSIVFWLLIDKWIPHAVEFSEPIVWIPTMVALGFIGGTIGLGYLLLRGRILLVIPIIVGANYLIFLGFSWFAMLACAILFFVYLWVGSSVEKEFNERVKLRPGETMRRSLGLILFPLFVMISFAYFANPEIQRTAVDAKVPANLGRVFDKTIQVFFKADLSKLPVYQQQQIRTQVLKETVSRIDPLLNQYSKFIPPVLAVVVFLILQALSFIFIWLGSLWVALIFKILKKTQFITIKKTSVEVERIDGI